jgi:hypothetical protein
MPPGNDEGLYALSSGNNYCADPREHRRLRQVKFNAGLPHVRR